MSLAQPIQDLIARVDGWRDEVISHESSTLLEVDALVSSAATFYEKVRYLIDYREEHTIRRSAIERILKRRALIESQPIFGDEILKELAEGQYLSKEVATEELAKVISDIVARYQSLAAESRISGGGQRRLLSFAATEIERLFAAESYEIDDAVAETFYTMMRPHVSVRDTSAQTVDAQLRAAVRRALLQEDTETVFYALWRTRIQTWGSDQLDLRALIAELPQTLTRIEHDLAHPLQWQLQSKIKNETIYFRILRELLQQRKGSAEWVLSSEGELKSFTTSFLEETYVAENRKLQASGVRAVGYLFFTKIIAAFVFELPYELFVLGKVHYVPLLTNTLFHPLLLLAFTRGIGSLNGSNTDAVVAGLTGLVHSGKVRTVRIKPDHSGLTALFGLVYFLLMCALFLGIVGILTALNFNFVSMVLFVFFLALVSYFAFRIRSNAQRWKVSGSEGKLSIIVHVLAVPIVRAGRWLSKTFSSINILVLFMDFILETPFKLLLNFSRKFFVYLREKAEDVY